MTTSTPKYTLPGVMQYLQAQFTLAERNRMQADLERASLKLRIIELEHERNALLRRNADLEAQLGATADSSKQDVKPQDLDDVQAVDVQNLIRAKQFLKSATNEIIYLLNSPLIDISDDASTFSATSLPDLLPNDNTEKANAKGAAVGPLGGSSSPFHELDSQDLGEPFKSQPSNDVQSDQETITDSLDEEDGHDQDSPVKNTKLEQKKPVQILKKSLKLESLSDIKLAEFNPYVQLKSNKLFVQYTNKMNVYSTTDNSLICSIDLPTPKPDFLTYNGDLLTYVYENTLFCSTLTAQPSSFELDIGESQQITHLDLNEDNILFMTKDSILFYEIDENEIKLLSKHPFDPTDEPINDIKLINHHPKYDMVILTPNTLSFFKIENAPTSKPLTPLNDIQLANYHKWHLNSMNLVLQFDHGLYLMDLEDPSEFKNIPAATAEQFSLGSSFDDESLFYIWQKNTSGVEGGQLKVFQSTSIGTIVQVKTLDQIPESFAIGLVDRKRVLVESKVKKLIVQNF